MKKTISGIIIGIMCAGVLTWAHDAVGENGQSEPAVSEAEAADDQRTGNRSWRNARRSLQSRVDGSQMYLSRGMLEKVDLTDAQKEEIKALRSQYDRDMVQLRAETRLAQIDLREQLNMARADVAEVKEIVARVTQAQGSEFERRVVFRVEMRNVLTPEQQEAIREAFRERRSEPRDSDTRRRGGRRDSRNRR